MSEKMAGAAGRAEEDGEERFFRMMDREAKRAEELEEAQMQMYAEAEGKALSEMRALQAYWDREDR